MDALLDAAAGPADSVGRPLHEPLLALTGVSKAWGARTILDEVDLELAPGAMSWLGGANGAGKTTLLRIACGLLGPEAGEVALAGLHPRRDRRAFQRRLGFLAAGDRGLYARLTVQDHLNLWARLALIPRSEIPAAQERTVEALALEELLPSRTDRMSMGQRQRLRLAMAFMHGPDVVLLDEPLNSLDETGADSLRTCAAGVTERGGAVLWCSPGTDRDLAPFSARYWLAQGTIEQVA